MFAALTPALSRQREREPNWAAGIRALSSMERESGPLSLWERDSGSLSLWERARVREAGLHPLSPWERARVRVLAVCRALTPTLSRRREREPKPTPATLATPFIPSPLGDTARLDHPFSSPLPVGEG